MDTDFADSIVALLPRLRSFALALAGTSSEGDDLVQATCEKALMARASWRPDTRLDSWMFRIMQNHWIDGHRRRRPHVPVDTVIDDGTLGREDGARTAEARLTLQDVSSALERLPEEQRSVLVLVCVEDMSYREAADIVGVPIGTVMSRLARARRALSEAVGHSAERSDEGRTMRPGAAR